MDIISPDKARETSDFHVNEIADQYIQFAYRRIEESAKRGHYETSLTIMNSRSVVIAAEVKNYFVKAGFKADLRSKSREDDFILTISWS